MKTLRWNFVFIVAWFFFFYNIERLIAPINIASFVYIYAPILAVLVITVPALYKANLWILFIFILIPFFGLKAMLNYEIAGTNLTITITEICALGISLGFSRRVGSMLGVLQDEISQMAFGQDYPQIRDFKLEQSQIYREIRYARRKGLPASLLAISVSEKSANLSLHQFVEEAKNNITKRYIASKVAKLLTEELHDSDEITQRGNHFIVLLPDTTWENALIVIKRIKASAETNLKLRLHIGLSSFPDEALTFERLLESAESKMISDIDNDVQQAVQETGIPIDAKIISGRT